MVKPGNDPQDPQGVAGSVREKLKRFSSELTDDERVYVEARMKKVASSSAAGTRPLISAPGIGLVVNNSRKPLVVTKIYTGDRAVEDVFDGASPKVGDVIAPGQTYSFTWVEWFFGSDCDTYLQAQDGSGTIRTRVGMNLVTGWNYDCDQASGTLACEQPGSDHPTWNLNVGVIDR
jgi:hypothetical protein